MGCHRLIVPITFLLFAKEYEVSTQHISVGCTSPTARPLRHSGQYVLPIIIQPINPGQGAYVPEQAATANCHNYGNNPAPHPGYPIIIIEDDNDIWQQLLYFTIFALQNKKSCGCGCNSCHCGCCGSGSCGCCCGCSCGCSSCNNNNNSNKNNSNDNTSAPTYIPIPFAVPFFPGCDGWPYYDAGNDCSDDMQVSPGRENEINVIIRTE